MLKCALLFPGQGSQYPGAGKDIYDRNEEARIVMDKAEGILGRSISEVMFNGTEAEIKKTENAQLSMLIASMMYYEAWKNDFSGEEIKYAVAGHSLGEFTALYAAGVLSIEDAIKLVKSRSELMARCCSEEQGMFAMFDRDEEEIKEDIEGGRLRATIANINSKNQIVVSGLKKEIEEYEGEKKELAVSGAFHSSYMKEANEAFGKELDKINLDEPDCLFISNYTGKTAGDSNEIKENLKRQMTNPVRWLDTVLTIKGSGADLMREIGPGDTLKKLSGTIVFKPKCK